MRKILHLSDLHMGKKKCSATFKRIIDNIINRHSGNEFIVVITGDLIDDATVTTQLDEAVAQVKRLQDHFGPEHVLIVPGNHDCSDHNKGISVLMRKFKNAFYSNPNELFPRCSFIDDIAFIGLDSMAKEMDKDDGFAAQGELGGVQRKDLEQLLSSDPRIINSAYRVVYLHHRPVKYHMPGMLLVDHKKLKKVVRGKIDMMLFGHEHTADVWHNDRNWQISRMYNAGRSTSNHRIGPHRIIDLASDPHSDIPGNFY